MIIDLTQTFSSGQDGFSSKVAKTVGADGWNASTLQFYSHAGTHMDAPIHFQASSQAIDQLPVQRFVGRAWVVNVTVRTDGQLITEDDFEEYADDIEPGDSVIIKTGWYQYVNQPKFRNGLPRISESLAHWLVAKKINRLVVESPSVADVNNLKEVSLIHQVLFKGDIIIVEGICNTGSLTAKIVELITLPLKIKEGDGAPARVIAIQK